MIVIANSLSEVPTATQDAADRVYVRDREAPMLGPSFKDRKGGGEGFILSTSMEQNLGLELPPTYKWGDEVQWTRKKAPKHTGRRGIYLTALRDGHYVILDGDVTATKVFDEELEPA